MMEDKLQILCEGMETCYQTSDMNMLQHGEMVADYYEDLYLLLLGKTPRFEWKLPDLSGLPLTKVLSPCATRQHLIYHDCGKHLCKVMDEQGRAHYPNHAEISAEAYFDATGDEVASWFIRHDMDLHTLKGDALEEMLSNKRIFTLLLTAWAEIHANAVMFGGIDSTSFKIKWKHLARITKRLLK